MDASLLDCPATAPTSSGHECAAHPCTRVCPRPHSSWHRFHAVTWRGLRRREAGWAQPRRGEARPASSMSPAARACPRRRSPARCGARPRCPSRPATGCCGPRPSWPTCPRRRPPGWPPAGPARSAWWCRSPTGGSSPRCSPGWRVRSGEAGYDLLLYNVGDPAGRRHFFDAMPLRRRVDAVHRGRLVVQPGRAGGAARARRAARGGRRAPCPASPGSASTTRPAPRSPSGTCCCSGTGTSR